MADDWLDEYRSRKAKEERTARDCLRRACDVLARIGVRTVKLTYDGEDGSGSAYHVAYEPEPPDGLRDELDEVLKEAAYWLLPPGWELDAGAFGALTLDLPARKAYRDHHQRIHFSQQVVEELDL